MGSTFGCARCHDHKYDPLKQREYYSMYAFLNSVPEKGLDGRTGNAEPMPVAYSRSEVAAGRNCVLDKES
jgi:hypothetical protein